MQFKIIFKVIGMLLMLFSITQLPPIFIDIIYGEDMKYPFLINFTFSLFIGVIAWYPVRKIKQGFHIREGVLVVVSFWIVLSLFGSIPFVLIDISFTNAFFESMSGLTTTGATILTGLDNLPKALLYYRQQLQWLGGMGIIALAIAILPMLGVGGMQLYRAETPGINKDKLTPKIAHTAKVLWIIYMSLTIICALFYYLAGMSLFDAITHSFSTIAIGGFSTHDASIAYFQSSNIELVAIIFMAISGVNFSLHFVAWQRRSFKNYFKDIEFKTYFLILSFLAVITFFVLYFDDYYPTSSETIRHATFQAVSIATTTGFASQNYSLWPAILPVLLIFASFSGACAGSTGGGMKVIRTILLFKQGIKEIKNLIHPSARVVVKIGDKAIQPKIIMAVWGFLSLYVFMFVVVMLSLMFTGLDQVTAFSATAASINNLGPGLGEVAEHYANINDVAKWVLSFAMLLGRLEILTLIAMFHRSFWQF